MKKTIPFFIVTLFLPQVLRAVSLQEAIERGIRLNLGHRNQILNQKIQTIETKNANVKRYFNLDLGGSYLFKSDRMEIEMPDIHPAPGIIIPGQKIIAGAKHNVDLNLSLTQPLFIGKRLLNALKIEKIKETIERTKIQLSKIEIMSNIKATYFNYKLLINKKQSLEILIKKINLHHKKLQDFFKEDLIKKSDLLETEAKVQELILQLKDLEIAINKEKINFSSLCDLPIEDIEEGFTERIKTYQESLSDFKFIHPSLKIIDQQIAIFLAKKNIARGAYLPIIAGFAELHTGRPGIDFFKNEWSIYFLGGISIDWRLFNWNQQRRDTAIIDYTIEKLKNRKADLIKTAKKNLKQLFDAKTSIEEKLKIMKNLLRLSEEDIYMKEKLLKEHQIPNIDFLTALTTKEQYLSMKNEMATQLELIKLNINKIIGKEQEEK